MTGEQQELTPTVLINLRQRVRLAIDQGSINIAVDARLLDALLTASLQSTPGT